MHGGRPIRNFPSLLTTRLPPSPCTVYNIGDRVVGQTDIVLSRRAARNRPPTIKGTIKSRGKGNCYYVDWDDIGTTMFHSHENLTIVQTGGLTDAEADFIESQPTIPAPCGWTSVSDDCGCELSDCSDCDRQSRLTKSSVGRSKKGRSKKGSGGKGGGGKGGGGKGGGGKGGGLALGVENHVPTPGG